MGTDDGRPVNSLVSTKFDVYRDDDSPVIYDVDEERAIQRERQRQRQELEDQQESAIGERVAATAERTAAVNPKFAQLNLERKYSTVPVSEVWYNISRAGLKLEVGPEQLIL